MPLGQRHADFPLNREGRAKTDRHSRRAEIFDAGFKLMAITVKDQNGVARFQAQNRLQIPEMIRAEHALRSICSVSGL